MAARPVRQESDCDIDTACRQRGDKTAGAERLVIRMRREDEPAAILMARDEGPRTAQQACPAASSRNGRRCLSRHEGLRWCGRKNVAGFEKCRAPFAVRNVVLSNLKGVIMRSVFLWLIGVPIPIILLLAMCTHHF